MEEVDVAVVGGGPAGLRAAEVAASRGKSVVVFEGKRGVGRKFLVAGKGGLNLTHGEAFDGFVSRYSGGEIWEKLIEDFKPEDLREWCHGLGQETFQASSGRVYPKTLKGAPVLRAWLLRLKEMGVEFRVNHRWVGMSSDRVLRFENGAEVRAKKVVFALGGGSWPKTGSDGGWVKIFQEMGIGCAPLRSSNCGWECDWPDEVLVMEGMPLKNIRVGAGETEVSGELMVTRYGLEGGAIYALGRELRGMESPALEIDFKPTFSVADLVRKLGGAKGGFFPLALERWKLSAAAVAVVSRKRYETMEELATAVKCCRVELNRERPIEEAISSAGGVLWSEVDDELMLKKFSGVFVCGEMLDWDAPTGGYLLQGAFAMGTRVGTAI
ncbi:MAG: NAD(P)/FAD-dependent oxidoreductase [Luteolibacter sp.]